MDCQEIYKNFTTATVIGGNAADRVERKAIEGLLAEVAARTKIRFFSSEGDDSDRPRIIIGTQTSLAKWRRLYQPFWQELAEPGPEGYRILTIPGVVPAVLVIGADPRGALYGVGRLLRLMRLTEGLVEIPAGLKITSTPQYPLRGHQLGYRPKNNTYDAWTPEVFDQYIRELTFFGVNCIEILPPRTDDALVSPLMPTPPPEMMVRLAEIIDSYGLDVWVWYPNLGSDYRNPTVIAAELREREEVFSKLSRVDAVFIPGGDPGELEPALLFEWSGTVAGVLQRYHPQAKIWLSPQTFRPTPGWMESFYQEVQKGPDWLGGVVFGPWVKTPLAELRRMIPKQYPIRHYPDITHNYHCQFPAPDWDVAFAMTLGRECINPRPEALKAAHNLMTPNTIGSLTYSEGINDDVNKFIWSAQDWDQNTPVIATLRDYARVFISPDYCESIAQGLLALERDWEGPLLSNADVDRTWRQWRSLEQTAPQLLRNYRFLMGLFRAYYDAYLRRRLIYETELEQEALDILKRINESDADIAVLIRQAETKLQLASAQPVASDLRQRCFDLADDIFQMIGMQFSVSRHHTASWVRNAVIDDIDLPLNNSGWLLFQLNRIKELSGRRERLAAITEMLNRTNPGPGGFYDNFQGSESRRRVAAPGFNPVGELDGLQSAFIAHSTKMMDSFHHPDPDLETVGPVPLAWVNGVATMFSTPLSVHYENLDPEAVYRLRITYLYNKRYPRIRLIANEKELIHDYRSFKGDQLQQEFILAKELTAAGTLLLTWESAVGDQGPGVAELWLIRTDIQV